MAKATRNPNAKGLLKGAILHEALNVKNGQAKDTRTFEKPLVVSRKFMDLYQTVVKDALSKVTPRS